MVRIGPPVEVRRVLVGMVSLNEAEAHEDKQEDPANAKQAQGHRKIITHRPAEVFIGVRSRETAHCVVLGEQKRGGNNQHDQLQEEREEGAVERAESVPVEPNADEHDNGVGGDHSVGHAHDDGDDGELGALLLA